MLNLLKLIILSAYYNKDDENVKELSQYYQKNTDNLVFSSVIATIIIYLIGVVLNVYYIVVHIQTVYFNMKFYENDYLINHKLLEKCHKARILCACFATIFCIGNIFQMAMFNYSKEFESLAEGKNNENNANETDDKQMMDSWRIFFYFLVIMAILIKISLCFVQVVLGHFLIKFKYEYSKMFFELKNNISF